MSANNRIAIEWEAQIKNQIDYILTLNLINASYINATYIYVYIFLTFRKPAVLEKYFAFASFTFFSAACGLTISRPCKHG